MAGFLVPFLAGGITKALETRAEYDENAGNMVDAASEKYSAQFDVNVSVVFCLSFFILESYESHDYVFQSPSLRTIEW